MSISEALEQFRYVIFLGRVPKETISMTQEQYIEAYEQQIERDPAMENKLISEYSRPLIPIYREHIEQIAKMEQTLSGTNDPISYTDEEILNELYDEVTNLDSEEEWEKFKKIFLR